MNTAILTLHQAYCDATGYELSLNSSSERIWLAVHRFGFSADDVKLIVKGRVKRNQSLQFKMSLLIHRIFGDEDDLAVAANELAEIKALMRKPKFDAGKVTVLAATGRPTEPEQGGYKTTKDVILAMKEAAK